MERSQFIKLSYLYLRHRKSTNKLNLVHHSLLCINEGRIRDPTKLNVEFDTVTFLLEIVWYYFFVWSLILFISSTIYTIVMYNNLFSKYINLPYIQVLFNRVLTSLNIGKFR